MTRWRPHCDGWHRAPPDWAETEWAATEWAATAGAAAAPVPPALPDRGARRRRPVGLALVGAACALALLARAQDIPTSFGPDLLGSNGLTASGDLRQRIAAAFAAATPPAPDPTARAWSIIPALALQQEWTDNAGQTGTGRQASLITVLAPSLAINGDTSRLKGSLLYAPELDYYAEVPSQTRIGQNLDASAQLTLLPQALFLDLRGFAATQSLSGATAPSGSVALARSNQVQSSSFSAEPYLIQRFGGWGQARVGAVASDTTQGLLGSGAGGGETLRTRREYATLSSGENFGRVSGQLDLSASQFGGSGALQDAHHNLVNWQSGYAITHDIVALASIGWEDIRYSGAGAPRINEATWSFGARLTPNPDSSLLLAYGRRDGVTGPAITAVYALTPRTRLYVNYATGTSSDAEALQNGFAAAALDPLGNPIDAQTGAPLALTNNFYGLTGTVYRSRDLSATLSWLQDRDAVQLTLSRQTRTPLGAPVADFIAGNSLAQLTSGALASQGLSGSVAWQHELSPTVSSNVFVQYGRLTNTTPLTLSAGGLRLTGQQQQDTTLVVVSTGLSWRLSETLNAALQYSYTSDDFAAAQPGIAANLVALGLRKQF